MLEAASIAESEYVPPEDRVDRFRDKYDEDTPLPILLYDSRSVTFTKDYISTLPCEGILVGDDKYPAP